LRTKRTPAGAALNILRSSRIVLIARSHLGVRPVSGRHRGERRASPMPEAWGWIAACYWTTSAPVFLMTNPLVADSEPDTEVAMPLKASTSVMA
jgi:hypothetical protein